MFVFGTQYLRGATPERDQWKKDMESMKECGFNTIRAWLVWNAVEKQEGVYDHQYISDFLTLAKEYELDVGLLFHMHACPAWAVKKYSKYFYVDENNLPFEPAVRANTPSGGWPGLCYDHPEVREIEYNFISNVIKETKKHDNVVFYEPMNEPHQWIDFTKKPAGIFCYCPASVKKFQGWLKNKYNDIKTLNNAWGYYYNDFSEVRPPRWIPSFSEYTDFRLFTVDNIAEEIKYRTDIIRFCDVKPVIAHAWGGGTITCAQLGGSAFDDWKNAKIFDKWGYSAFPKSKNDCCSLGLGCEATRCAADGKEYWQSELTAGITGSLFNSTGRIDDETFDKFSLESIRHGASGLLYWQYRKERIGYEFGGFALTDYDGGPTPFTKKATELGKFFKEYGDTLKEGTKKDAEVALVFSMRSFLADWTASDKMSTKYSVDSVSGYYKMFWEENIPVDVIHEEFFKDLGKYKLIILPSSMAIAPQFAKALKEYIKNGGTVISDQSFGIFDDTLKLSYTVPGYGFDEVFGVKEDQLMVCDKATVTDGKNTYSVKGMRYKETLKDAKGKVLFTYDDNTPCIVSNNYGMGTAYLTGINLGFIYSDRELISDDIKNSDEAITYSFAKDFVIDICKNLSIKGNCCSAKDVKVSIIEAYNECIMILINNSPEDKQGTIKTEKNYKNVKPVYNDCICTIDKDEVKFTLGADKSVILKLN